MFLMCMCVGGCAYHNPNNLQVGSLLLPFGFQGQNSDGQPEKQVHLPTEHHTSPSYPFKSL